MALFEGLIFAGAYLRREICVSKSTGQAFYLEVNLPFLLCFTLYLRAIFQVQAPGGAYNWRGDLTEGFLRYCFVGLILGGAYTWRGLFSDFYGELHIITSFSRSEFCFPLAKLTHSLLCPTETWKKRIPMEYQMTLLMSGL